MFRMLRLTPPHGWNAVGWELGIVTAGVLIALGAQQWAENRSWNAKVAQSRQAITEELHKHSTYAVEWRVVQPCIDAQLDRLRQIVVASGDRLDKVDAHRDDILTSFVVRLPAKDYVDGSWQAAIADGVAPRLDPEVRSLLIDHYAAISELETNTAQSTVMERGLIPLAQPLELTPDVRFTLLDRIAALQALSRFIDLQAGQVLDYANRLKMVPPSAQVRDEVERYGTYKFCRARGLPLRSYVDAMRPVPN